MSLDKKAVNWIAHLARLDLSEAELDEMTPQLDVILNYVEQLSEVSTENVEPLSHPVKVQNVFRDDEPTDPLPVDQALSNAPKRQDDFFAVPSVFESNDDDK